jgi:hypothetical protein
VRFRRAVPASFGLIGELVVIVRKLRHDHDRLGFLIHSAIARISAARSRQCCGLSIFLLAVDLTPTRHVTRRSGPNLFSIALAAS